MRFLLCASGSAVLIGLAPACTPAPVDHLAADPSGSPGSYAFNDENPDDEQNAGDDENPADDNTGEGREGSDADDEPHLGGKVGDGLGDGADKPPGKRHGNGDCGSCADQKDSPEKHSDGVKNFGESGIDCGGTIAQTTPCPNGETCETSEDCEGGCRHGMCGYPGPDDEKKNGKETDVDCGGPVAPPCEAGAACATHSDCADLYCVENQCEVPTTTDGIQNGTETDVDCGGSSGVTCQFGHACLVDSDCATACDFAMHCSEAPSCKVHFGGDTCGLGEVGDPNAVHESCCRSLPVPGYQDAYHPNQQVFLDKYEITAGRVRAWVETITAQSEGVADLKTWVTENRPVIWNDEWTPYFPSGSDWEMVVLPHPPEDGNQKNVGTNYVFGAAEYTHVHGNNCYQGPDSYGYSTYYYPDDVMINQNGGLPRAISKEELDVKAMTCIPNALLAAFCHWDGGQLATPEALNAATQNGALLPIGDRDHVNITGDSGEPPSLYNYPAVDSSATHEGASRIAPPGRIATDATSFNGAEPWMDLQGNVHEVAIAGPTGFTFLYAGIGDGSAQISITSVPYPEYKAGFAGGRCMRFR
jgi:hypothetical protein